MPTDNSIWDEPQLEPWSVPPDVVDMGVIEVAEAIKEWFLENFEDPVGEMPRVDDEFVFVWGGPYSAREVIDSVFADVVPDQPIDHAVEMIERDGIVDWAPHVRRFRRGAMTFQLNAGTDLHRRMLGRIDDLERALEEICRPGIGHNDPSGLLNREPVTESDVKALRDAISSIRVQPIQPDEMPVAAIQSSDVLRSIGIRVGRFVVDKADTFLQEATKSAGSETGKWAIRISLFGLLSKALIEASRAILIWTHSLHLPF